MESLETSSPIRRNPASVHYPGQCEPLNLAVACINMCTTLKTVYTIRPFLVILLPSARFAFYLHGTCRPRLRRDVTTCTNARTHAHALARRESQLTGLHAQRTKSDGEPHPGEGAAARAREIDA